MPPTILSVPDATRIHAEPILECCGLPPPCMARCSARVPSLGPLLVTIFVRTNTVRKTEATRFVETDNRVSSRLPRVPQAKGMEPRAFSCASRNYGTGRARDAERDLLLPYNAPIVRVQVNHPLPRD